MHYTSIIAMGSVHQVQGVWQPLAFFSRNLSPAKRKNSANDRQILAIYEIVTYFRHKLENRHYPILTAHKPLTFAFQQEKQVYSKAVPYIWTSSSSSRRTFLTYMARISLKKSYPALRPSPRQ